MNEREAYHSIPARYIDNTDLIDESSFTWGPLVTQPDKILQKSLMRYAQRQLLPAFKFHPKRSSVLSQEFHKDYQSNIVTSDNQAFLTLVCGRKFFENISHNLSLPFGALIPPHYLLSVKGVGPTFVPVTVDLFKSSDPLGFTVAGYEQVIEFALMKNNRQSLGLEGGIKNLRMHLNRLTLGTAPIDKITSTSGKLVKIRDLKPHEYKAIIDDINPYVAILQANALDVTIHDILSHINSARARKFYNEHSLLEYFGFDSESIIIHYLQSLYVNLEKQPIYACLYEESQQMDKDRNFFLTWFSSRLLSHFAELLYEDAYIFSTTQHEGEYFHPNIFPDRIDNLTFAGWHDLGDVCFQSQFFPNEANPSEYVFEKVIQYSSDVLYLTAEMLASFMTYSQRLKAGTYFYRLWREVIYSDDHVDVRRVTWARDMFRTSLLLGFGLNAIE